MKTAVGLWIDHRKAVIVVVSKGGEETRVIESHADKHPGRSDGVRATAPLEKQHVQADDIRERKFMGHLDAYYDEIVSFIRDAESILIFGPGEAKGELAKRLERHRLAQHILAVETADRMTDRQIAAKVRERFDE